MRRAFALAVVAVLGLASLAGCGTGGGGDARPERVDRVLVVSLPGVGWADVQDADLPNLEAFVEDAAVGDISTRIGRHDASTTEAYLTLGAGTRAVAPLVDMAVAVDRDETYGGVPTAEILERRLGFVPAGIAYLGMGAAVDANDKSAFGAEVGTLGDALSDAGVDRAVIANADAVEGFVSDEPPPDGSYARGAATALIDSEGMVPGGTVGRSLLADDPDAPFGHRLDPEQVLAAFDGAWSGRDLLSPRRSVVLVEASDLSRADAYGPRTTGAQRGALRARALADADALLGRLLERVDPERDAVIVLSPVASPTSPGLGIAALRRPGVDPELLRSATTRRDGYVQLADVAPTVLSLLGEDAPDTIEGRAFQVRGGSGGDRIGRLSDASDEADFRDSVLPPVVTVIVTALVALTLATWQRRRLGPRPRSVLAAGAFGVLGAVPATFLVGRIGAVGTDTLRYVATLVTITALLAAAAAWVERRWPGLGVTVGVAAIVTAIGVDVAWGTPLQMNTVFGYSVAVAGRFVGLGNLAFALFGSATILLAALVVDRSGRRGLGLAIGLLAVVLLLEGLPMLGADVGGVAAMVPAFGVTALLLAGRRIGWREVLALALATGVALLAFAFIDAARPEDVQTHLARLADHVLEGRWSTFFRSLTRRWEASLGGGELAAWLTVSALVAAAGVYATLAALGRVGPRVAARERHRPTVAAAAGLAVLGTIGLVANDSSVAVPMTMFIVIVPVVTLRAVGAPGAAR
ncbi:MAG TPA: hypothetical protein VFG94_02315 [Acidimicrobiales bacterium]|nr:hypothetical protein [Acidimicrobiales bacterium]